MQAYFNELADQLQASLKGSERFTALFEAEDSDFCRLNGGKIRQAGTVRQASIGLRLIDGQRNAEGSLTLAGVPTQDKEQLALLMKDLRDAVALAPEDPYLLYATEPRSTEHRGTNALPDPRETVAQIAKEARGADLVGIYASGSIQRGFANSFGQRNWFESYSFNFDFSLYLRADKAVKSAYAGFAWELPELTRKLDVARQQLAVLDKTPREVTPGRYRVYLAPSALAEVSDMLSWGGFSEKARRTRQSPLLKVYEGESRLSAAVTLKERTAGGIAPDFNGLGFVKPPEVPLVEAGAATGALISPRTAKEYGVDTNGADGSEAPQSFDMAAGSLARDRAAEALGEGLYVNNLWYLNFSDRAACRVTGMTRFATFWVEGGKIVAPVPVMRFDESVLRMLGDKLEGLTSERDYLFHAGTYGGRSTSTSRLPGALVDQFALTL